jgi:hypothetical protein
MYARYSATVAVLDQALVFVASLIEYVEGVRGVIRTSASLYLRPRGCAA